MHMPSKEKKGERRMKKTEKKVGISNAKMLMPCSLGRS